jgi:hypothetical protein
MTISGRAGLCYGHLRIVGSHAGLLRIGLVQARSGRLLLLLEVLLLLQLLRVGLQADQLLLDHGLLGRLRRLVARHQLPPLQVHLLRCHAMRVRFCCQFVSIGQWQLFR